MNKPHNTADMVLHPVRLGIIQGLLGGRRLTTAQIAEELPEVTPATLYRHISTLTQAGILEVVGQQRIRGAVERTYALRLEASELSPGELNSMTEEQHRQAFTAFVAGVLRNFDRYVEEADGVDLVRDGVGYRQTAVWLTDEEFGKLAEGFRSAILPYADNPASPERTRRLISMIVMPSA
ncbi:helix-turn-helix domain-containing protein [Arthrobacter sp. MSA 4-2]|uniref:helix-turn-helix domain-containing protein n=1 Tax=Arthrobacter sp. MSA 4-2 TaxID=2794349 RepID=UPI0018E8B69E|nr:helix-turn-helix domain-containing protein [Arthrobacter sp. MSA 4-2]MBJ2119742.1 helix-turn-helix domain-containing protein [Arthrobacter sp. MSA 4-2]